jgi:peptidylprolyl isomerase
LASLCLGVAGASAEKAPDPAVWRLLSPEETLYIDTAQGRVAVELYPEIAPGHVARVKALAREGFYDGLTFHRVIDKFMAQTGDPQGDGTGGSTLGDLKAEFGFRRGEDMPFIEASAQGGTSQGFYKTLPIETQPSALMLSRADRKVRAWGLHCPGVASMARSNEEDSANSQFFLMRAPYPSLDGRYSVWGRVVWGQEAVGALKVGEPPENPDRMLQVRVAADMAETERAPIYVLRTDSPDFRELIERTRKQRGADFSVCDVQVPVRVPGYGARNERERPWWRNIPLIP